MSFKTTDRQARQDEEDFFNMIKRRAKQMGDAEEEWLRHYGEIYSRASAEDRLEMEAVKLAFNNRSKVTRGL